MVHFYEDFLTAYDYELREMRGVYYTPEPVVSYIVRSIDRLLRDRFGLVDGLANTEVMKGSDGQPDTPRVLILDPAAGTGTFLREVVSIIRETVHGKGLGGAWDGYVRDHLLPRLYGFELLMAPYAICHLKLALEIAGPEAGFSMPEGERLNVYLTNTLEEAHESASGPLFAHEIAREAGSADAVKRDKPVMVVLGNPPYSGHSANKGPWIRGLLRGKDGGEQTGSYFEVNGEPLGERNPKWLNDDYVKFIRFAQRRIERTGEGVLGFVTNHSYLDNPTFRGMRQSLMDTFDEIFLLDLHGNSNKMEKTPEGNKDENVFDIRQGVAIGIFVKGSGNRAGPARVFHADLWGERESGPEGGKYGWLAANDIDSTTWDELAPKAPRYLFIPRDEVLAEEYEAGWSIPEIFPVNSVGIVTAKDKLAIQLTRNRMQEVAAALPSLSEEEVRVRFNLGQRISDSTIRQAQVDIRSHPEADKHLTSVLYRPFDIKWTYYTGQTDGFICRPRSQVMRHMLAGPNLSLIASRQASVDDAYSHVLVSRSIVDARCVYTSRGIILQCPLYVYSQTAQKQFDTPVRPNLNDRFTSSLGSRVGLAYDPNGTGDLRTSVGPEDVFHYVYAVLHSPEYRNRYAELLKLDFLGCQ